MNQPVCATKFTPIPAAEPHPLSLAMAGILGSLSGRDGRAMSVSYDTLEQIKRRAAAICADKNAVRDHATAFLAHAWAHWARAFQQLNQQWSADDLDETFPNSVSFREYLAGWLSAVGVPKLNIDNEQLNAIYQMTMVAPIAHPLLPVGRSSFINPAQEGIKP